VYLLKGNNSFKNYLKTDHTYKETTYYINKSGLGLECDGGLIYIFSKEKKSPNWLESIKSIAKSDKKIKTRSTLEYKSLVFIKIKSSILSERNIFALAYGGGHHFLKPEFIVKDFAIHVSRKLLKPDKISTIDSIALDKKIYNTRKQNSSLLSEDKLLNSGEYSIIKKIYGQTNGSDLLSSNSKALFLGGDNSLQVGGEIDLNAELIQLLVSLANVYHNKKTYNFEVDEILKPVTDNVRLQKLNSLLETKLTSLITSKTFDKRNLKGLNLNINKVFDLKNFNGFFIKGIGKRNTALTGEFELIAYDLFEDLRNIHNQTNKLSNGPEIIKRLSSNYIFRNFTNDDEPEKVCSIFEALSWETIYSSEKYILANGHWYYINKQIYQRVKKFVDAIAEPPNSTALKYISFDEKRHINANGDKSEGAYNEDLAYINQRLMLDRTKYSPGAKYLNTLQIKSSSNIEISDLFLYDSNVIEFIHIKRHSGGASGTSHLVSQALTSARIFVEDTTKVVKFINDEINRHNKKIPFQDKCKNQINYQIQPFKYTNNQDKQITLVIIDKKYKNSTTKTIANSSLFSILELITVAENIRTIKNLGFSCYLKFVPSNE